VAVPVDPATRNLAPILFIERGAIEIVFPHQFIPSLLGLHGHGEATAAESGKHSFCLHFSLFIKG
jgi:hypothetical protein